MTNAELAVAHLQKDVFEKVTRDLIRKTIAELSHELLLEPRLVGMDGTWGSYVLATDVEHVEYAFRAQILLLDHWHIDASSIVRRASGRETSLDAMTCIAELAHTLEIEAEMLEAYLEEINSTLYGAAYKHVHQRHTAETLAVASFQDIETSMTEGHPTFVANNGRIGFDANDYRAYAPEAASTLSLVWLAAHQSLTTFSSITTLDYEALLEDELGARTVAAFRASLAARGLDASQYLFLPVHPWQWHNKLASLFADDIAHDRLVHLGGTEDKYFAQQSIRTLFNVTHPRKRYVKTALSILNMGFMRGLSPHYMEGTPAINEHVHAVVEGDAFLRARGFSILREVASIGYRKPQLEQYAAKGSPYRKMLAALWRESPVTRVRQTSRLMTMAALLHRDRDGAALVTELIKASGLSTDAWLARYFDAYLVPILHCFYAHDMVFMPHGENIILVLEGHLPCGAFMKDIGEEVAVFGSGEDLPASVRRIALSIPSDIRLLSIFTDVFDCFFRYLAAILHETIDYPETRFWALVADAIHTYGAQHQGLADKLRAYDLFVARFQRSCLNRLQLRNNRHMLDLSNPAGALRFAGTLENPIAPYRRPL